MKSITLHLILILGILIGIPLGLRAVLSSVEPREITPDYVYWKSDLHVTQEPSSVSELQPAYNPQKAGLNE